MRLRRLVLILSCVAASCAVASATAQAGPPRWYVQETGARVPLDDQSGLLEPPSPETIQSQGGLKVFGSETRTKPSECLTKDREKISDPADKAQPGTGQMEEFELLCEKSTGFGNYAEPHPCAGGEPFEIKAVGLPWSSSLDVHESERHLLYMSDHFLSAAVEVFCLVTREHDEYRGALKPEVALGKINYRGTESGVLLDSSGNHLYFKGLDYVAPVNYKAVRALAFYNEQPAITALSPQAGPKAGGTAVTVKGSGFALGGATQFKFGRAFGSEANCLLTTECTVLSPAGSVGIVRVTATVGGKTSRSSNHGDEYTYE